MTKELIKEVVRETVRDGEYRLDGVVNLIVRTI